MKRLLSFVLCFLFIVSFCFGQDVEVKNQVIRGAIVDRTTGRGIKNAYVELLNHTPRITGVSNENGTFELKNVPVGHQRIRVELDGYYEAIHSELVVAGKQSVVSIEMDEELSTGIVVVEASRSKRKDEGRYRSAKMEAKDEMNTVSVRAFNVEDVVKYVGSYGDPARTITNFPGMFNIDDTQNYIVSRGNSPYGIQWLIEGVPVENPHHFATMGNTGAIFPILNNNLLEKSDFVNGALAAQYNNAYSGVFDVKLRKGNNERHEFAAQLSSFGAEFVAEGPFRKKGASYAIALRTGIFDLLQLANIDLGSNATPRYYDVNFKFDIPTKKAGRFSIFGLGGLSDVDILGENIDTSDLFAEYGIDFYSNAGLGLVGLKHQIFIDQNTSLTTTLSYLVEDWHSYRDSLLPNEKMPYFDVADFRQRIGLSTVFNKKFTPQVTLRAGASGYLHHLNIFEEYLQTGLLQAEYNGFEVLASGFAQVQYKFSPRFIVTLGVQGMYWSLNDKSWAVEPRLALNWYVGKRHKLSLGYGWHSKIQTFPIAFYLEQRPDGSYDNSNLDLGPTRSHHLVLSYDAYLAKNWGLKTNVYAQYMTDVAVETTPSSISILNYGAFGDYPNISGWENTGEGFSAGVELSIEKFFSQGYYGLVSGTYQRTFYRASDMIWRNSAFDVQYIASTAMGKEFKIGKKKRNIFYADLRFNLHGGLPYTPIDLEASRLAGEEVLKLDEAYSQRVGIYKRIDVRLGVRLNHRKKRISHHIYVEVINVANFKNDLDVRFSPVNQQIVRAKQFGFLPNLFYQIRF